MVDILTLHMSGKFEPNQIRFGSYELSPIVTDTGFSFFLRDMILSPDLSPKSNELFLL